MVEERYTRLCRRDVGDGRWWRRGKEMVEGRCRRRRRRGKVDGGGEV